MHRALILVLILACTTACFHRQLPQQPVPPAPSEAPVPPRVTLEPLYDVAAEELTFEAAGITVHGTITRPAVDGTFPALLMIPGSGPTDRDWNSRLLPGNNGSGRLLAEALARRGVVVLRYDKRGTGQTDFPGDLCWDDYLAEQRAGLALLAADPAVDPNLIFPAGHSEGGVHAVRLADDPGIALAGLILLATPGQPMLETVIEQVQDKIRLGNVPAEKEAQMLGSLRTVLDQFVAGEEMDLSLLGGDAGLLSVAIAFRQPAARSFISEILVFDPAAALAASGLPVLILNGDRDMQVKPSPDADLLEAAALGAGLAVIRRDIAEADHVLKLEQTPVEQLGPHLAVHYNAEERMIHPQVVETIAEWLKKQQADA